MSDMYAYMSIGIMYRSDMYEYLCYNMYDMSQGT